MIYQPVLTARIGVVDPTSLTDYEAHGGFKALSRSIEIGSDEIIDITTQAHVLGRGGAAFPAGIKWKAVSEEPGPKYRTTKGRHRARLSYAMPMRVSLAPSKTA